MFMNFDTVKKITSNNKDVILSSEYTNSGYLRECYKSCTGLSKETIDTEKEKETSKEASMLINIIIINFTKKNTENRQEKITAQTSFSTAFNSGEISVPHQLLDVYSTRCNQRPKSSLNCVH